MVKRSYASFEVLIESEAESVDEAKREVVEWIRENADKVTEDNVEAVRLPSPEMHPPRTLKIGDRVMGVLGNAQEVGTVISLLLIGRNGPEAFVRFDNGKLRGMTLDKLTLLD
ncbi:hypothetical protein AKJ45_02105 [candidate division MSBL1 archaeon SCGC-AAA261F19]|uniref:Uncharacterized protein n=2 Tax=candidate division MSBL1 TaxID=215777 RepID=A0A133V9U5_9EURY|nr:hypothetical protein AKJ43_02195 [candidate division MSBL1 archaeon SCGC-AAA261D19]KXB03238.1 hypothetical protein AKJ45_02105 [candidate division MSBL1 archaeon SCGC-AAA261F19]